MMPSAIEQTLLIAVLPFSQHVFNLIYSDADLQYFVHLLLEMPGQLGHETSTTFVNIRRPFISSMFNVARKLGRRDREQLSTPTSINCTWPLPTVLSAAETRSLVIEGRGRH